MGSPSTFDLSSVIDDHSSITDSIAGAGGFSPLDSISIDYSRTISEISTLSDLCSSDERQSFGWPSTVKLLDPASPVLTKLGMKQQAGEGDEAVLDLMRERFSKLLLGEDMSGGGKGVCSAVAISNAITNLYATVFGQFRRLEPLPPEKKAMWRREMDCLLSICDYIVEFHPSIQNLPNGSASEVMETRPRSDIHVNLPALEKLDTMLLDMLEGFHEKREFWYVEDGDRSPSVAVSRSFRRLVQKNEEKWWLPIPCVPSGGLSEKCLKDLRQKRDCANQIHKAAMAINNGILADMQVPQSYVATLPKSGRASVGDSIYRHLVAGEQFCTDYLLDYLDMSSEHEALETADRVEAAIYLWRRKASSGTGGVPRSSWEMVKDLVVDADKNEVLASRAQSFLIKLKHRHPGLSQTTLDTMKIQYNKDVGQGILESYSRVLESLAFSLVSFIDDVVSIDETVKRR
ncbi:Rop guanine nucleotide exchange factor 2 [Apostasia shenzhenica]|uniref:Rop guanine nucleotide exchange factor 2 n=1 Tax=Apostasia shenzhenica TaxID=1088818 RepID=A0A2I0AHH7_9ASPA|nr:Rop guanine nucleotide exchange factor 2 [Apostasia shenzhenica]